MKRSRLHAFLVYVLAITSIGQAQWIRQSGGLPSTWHIGYAIDACSPSVAVMSVNGPFPVVYLTKDGGASFLSLNAPEQAWDISIVDSAHIWFVSDSCIYATSDGGGSWHRQFSDKSVAPFLNYIRMFDLNNGVVVGDAALGKPMPILQTTDGGSHWTETNAASLIDMASSDTWREICFVSPSIGYIRTSLGAGRPQNIYKTTDGGSTWSSVFGFNGATVMRFYDPQFGLVSQFGTFYRTTNGGSTWDTLATNIGSLWGEDIEFLPGDPSRIWFSAASLTVHKLLFSSDTGRTWNQEEMPDAVSNIMDIVFTDQVHGWLLGNDGAVYRTTNGGHLYNRASTDGICSKYRMNVADSLASRLDHNAALFLVKSDSVSVSGRAVSWIYGYFGGTDLSPRQYYFHVTADSAVHDSTHLGIFVGPKDFTKEWIDSDSALFIASAQGGRQFCTSNPRYRISAYLIEAVVPQSEPYWIIEYASLDNPANTLTIAVKATITSVLGRNLESSPSQFTLCQNYPNPFNPSTTIRFDLSKESYVKLEVYNVLGERIASLVNEVRRAGAYSEKFDGSEIPSGVYFYRIQAGSYSTTKKLVLMK